VTADQFKGFGGIRLSADRLGDSDQPAVLLLHDRGTSREDWGAVADALQMAGRHVINLDLRGHGSSEWPAEGRYGFDAFVEDVRAVLAQLPSRPAIVAVGLGALAATCALGEDGAHLASALVLVSGSPAPLGDPDEMLFSLTGTGSARFDPRLAKVQDGDAAIARAAGAAARIQAPVLMVGTGDYSAAMARLAAALPAAEQAHAGGVGAFGGAERSDEFSALLLDFLERRVPLAPPEYREGSDARTFRDALGCFATGITVITAMTPDGVPVGLTANSFTSVSLDPPLLLVCIANSVSSAAIMRDAPRFAVNMLQIGQQPTSNRFAGKGEDRFAATPWTVGEYGTPVLTGSLSSFECDRHAVHDGGDHFILVGRVLKAMFEPQRDPLLYFRGKYRRLHFA
jgi:flavin reductase (DIM6/NTAB) family NADH-FMN oxidoreductase RutF/pimeloyl-ACP methyl ester carboxylesterase